jgi:DNA-binding transcriptional LysR family regulator
VVPWTKPAVPPPAMSASVGALPRSSLQEAFGQRELVELPFRPPAPSTTGGVAYLKNRMLPPAAEVLIKEIVDHFQSFNKVDSPPGGTANTGEA